MKGYGWECDNCHERVVDDRDPFMAGPNATPPPGWLVLAGPFMDASSPEAWHAVERHFCSLPCLAMAAAEQIGAALSARGAS